MTTSHRYHERLYPGPGWCVGALGAGVLVGVAVWPLGARWALVAGVTAGLAALLGLWRSAPVITVDQATVEAGTARLPVAFLGELSIVTGDERRSALGPQLDARAYLCLRTWAPAMVRIELTDPKDPTPYWLVSTRHPQALAEALVAARCGAGPAEPQIETIGRAPQEP